MYLCLEMFFKEGNPEKEAIEDHTVLFLTYLPFLFIFLIGCHSMYLTDMVYDEMKARKKE